MAEAIFGLIGVLIGALVTGGLDLILERRREKKLVRRAIRLVGDELHKVWVSLSMLVQAGTAPPMQEPEPELFLPTSAWAAHREILVDEIPNDAWDEIAFLLGNNITGLRLHLLHEIKPGQPFSSGMSEMIRKNAEQIAVVYEFLIGHRPRGEEFFLESP
jgi:hypothetical protein